MARLLHMPMPIHGSVKAEPISIGLFLSVVALVALCTKHGGRVSRKLASRVWKNEERPSNSKIAPRSPSPKTLLTTLSNKTITLLYKKKLADDNDEVDGADGADGAEDGLWKKAILMGEKCQPPEFSGVIYYDHTGKQLPEFPPRSPRYSPLPGFDFPATLQEEARN